MLIEALLSTNDGGGGDNWTTGAISRAKLQSNHHHQQTNIQFFFTGRMPFLSPKQQCQSTEVKISHSMDLLTPSSPGVFQLGMCGIDFFNFGSGSVRFLKKTRIRFGMNLVRFGLQKLGSVRIVIYY